MFALYSRCFSIALGGRGYAARDFIIDPSALTKLLDVLVIRRGENFACSVWWSLEIRTRGTYFNTLTFHETFNSQFEGRCWSVVKKMACSKLSWRNMLYFESLSFNVFGESGSGNGFPIEYPKLDSGLYFFMYSKFNEWVIFNIFYLILLFSWIEKKTSFCCTQAFLVKTLVNIVHQCQQVQKVAKQIFLSLSFQISRKWLVSLFFTNFWLKKAWLFF